MRVVDLFVSGDVARNVLMNTDTVHPAWKDSILLCMVMPLVWRHLFVLCEWCGFVVHNTRYAHTMPCALWVFVCFFMVHVLARSSFFTMVVLLCIVMSLACGLCCCITMHWVTFFVCAVCDLCTIAYTGRVWLVCVGRWHAGGKFLNQVACFFFSIKGNKCAGSGAAVLPQQNLVKTCKPFF